MPSATVDKEHVWEAGAQFRNILTKEKKNYIKVPCYAGKSIYQSIQRLLIITEVTQRNTTQHMLTAGSPLPSIPLREGN